MTHYKIGPQARSPAVPEEVRKVFGQWAQFVEDALNARVNFSTISTADGPESAGTYAAPKGALRVDVGSSTTRLWVKGDDSTLTGGWQTFA